MIDSIWTVTNALVGLGILWVSISAGRDDTVEGQICGVFGILIAALFFLTVYVDLA